MILLITAILLMVVMRCDGVIARPQPQQYYGAGGGVIDGYVLGVNKQPLEWADIYADNGQHKFLAISGMGGFYEMRVPQSTYNITIDVPGYEALVPTQVTVTNGSTTRMNFNLNSITVSVSSGSSGVINFYLEQTQTPVPEVQPGLSLVLIASLLGALLLVRSRPSTRSALCRRYSVRTSRHRTDGHALQRNNRRGC